MLIGNPRGEWAQIRCPVHKGGDERNAFMSVSLVDGHFACHACGEKGGIVKLHCCVLAWAFAMPCETLGGASMSETPREAARRLFGSKIALGYMPVALHTYVNADGQEIYHRARLEHPDGEAAPEGRKFIRPFQLNGNGYKIGEPDYPDGRKPIYNLDRIAANPDAPVHIVEGEKAADALTKLDAVATTSGGADSAGRADWTSLARRTCVLWADNDEAGREYMTQVAAILETLGCKLSAIDIDALGLPAKGDAFDWLVLSRSLARRFAGAADGVLARAPTVSAPQSDLGASWPVLDDAARYGLVGELLAAIEPQTEADAAAILRASADRVRYLRRQKWLCPRGRGPALLQSVRHHRRQHERRAQGHILWPRAAGVR